MEEGLRCFNGCGRKVEQFGLCKDCVEFFRNLKLDAEQKPCLKERQPENKKASPE